MSSPFEEILLVILAHPRPPRHNQGLLQHHPLQQHPKHHHLLLLLLLTRTLIYELACVEHQQARIEEQEKSETTIVEENEIEQEEETDLSLADLRSNLRNQIVPQLASTLVPLTSAENALVEDALFSQERTRRGRDILGQFASHIIIRKDMET